MARASTPKSSAGDTIVSLKVTLQGLRPPIWRRVLVPASIRLGALSEVIQAAMGWDGGHLHSFTIAGRDYGERGVLDDVADENRATLGGAVKTGVKRFTYTYDFGDSWEHIVAIEKTEPVSRPGQSYPVCVAGKRNCPRKTAAASGVTRSSWKSSPIPPTRNEPSASSGSTKTTSIPRPSTSS